MGNGSISIFIVVLITASILIYILWKNSREMDSAIKVTTQQRSLVMHDDRAIALCRAIRLLNPNVVPGVDYIILHDSPEQEPYLSEWLADTPRPSAEEINSALVEIADVRHEDKYAAMRRGNYPSIEDQMDAAYQARQGDNAKQLEVDEKIRHVKERYPKKVACL